MERLLFVECVENEREYAYAYQLSLHAQMSSWIICRQCYAECFKFKVNLFLLQFESFSLEFMCWRLDSRGSQIGRQSFVRSIKFTEQNSHEEVSVVTIECLSYLKVGCYRCAQVSPPSFLGGLSSPFHLLSYYKAECQLLALSF